MRRFWWIGILLPTLLLAQTQPLIHRERLTNLFLQLVRINSPSRQEAALANFLAEELRQLGAEVVAMDDSGKQVGGTSGNLFARFKGTVDAPPVLLSAHMDTIAPTQGIRLVQTESEIRTDGTTILGADNKAGLSLIIEAIRTLQERRLPHPPLEVVFTVCEEVGLLGAKAFDKSQLRARYGIVVDGAGEPGDLIIGSPTHIRFEVLFHGKSAHAGVEPEKGINAIAMASFAIAAMPWGRIDDETTTNLGVIEGGQAMNVVPDRCQVVGEFRSHDPKKVRQLLQQWQQLCEQAAQKLGGQVTFKAETTFEAVRLSPDEPIVKAAVEAAQALGLTPRLKRMGGGTDGNVFTAQGITCLVLPTGGENYHSTQERLVLPHFYRMGDLLVHMLINLARQP